MSPNAWCRWILGSVGIVGMLRIECALAQIATSTVALTAETTAVATTNAPDYSQGFRAFSRMGLPDTANAKYVRLEAYGGMYAMMSYSLNELQLSGNAWLLSENKGDWSTLATAAGKTLTLRDQKTFAKQQEAEARSNAVAQAARGGDSGARSVGASLSRRAGEWNAAGTWTPVDLSRDLAKAVAFVDKKIKAKADGGREMRYDAFLRSEEPSGLLFLLAAFAWQNGKVKEANALAGRLFTLIGDSRKVIVNAVNVMADAQLTAAADTFKQTRDWKAYHAEVTELLKKFSTGWRQAGAVKLLEAALLARSALTTPPAVTGEDLSAEDQVLAAALALATNRPGMSGGSGELWILPPSKAMRGGKDDSAVGRIKARGIKSIPLLIAMVSDETLCPVKRNEVGLPIVFSSSSSDSEQNEAERARSLYNQMDRPLTRGEIARALLAPLSPRDQNARYGETETTPEDAAAQAKEAYATLKALPPSALAMHFLNNGDQNQKQAAVNYLLQNEIETNAPAIEAFLLTPPSDDSETMRYHFGGNPLVQTYVQRRGEKAAEFVEKYAAMRKQIELPARMADNAEYVKQIEKQAENEIKNLRALAKKQDLSETLAAITLADNEEGVEMATYTALRGQAPATAVPILLAAAVKTTNANARVRILQMMPMLRYAGMEGALEAELMEAGEDAAAAILKKYADKNKLNISSNAAEWNILLADTRPMATGRRYAGTAVEMTVADLAATGIESLYGDSSQMEEWFGRHRTVEALRPNLMLKINRARAAARLAGKTEDELPKVPSADDVTADRRKALEAEVLNAKSEAMGAILDKLTDAESLYLSGVVGESEPIMKALTPLSRRVAAVQLAAALPAADAARLQKMTGAALPTNALAELRDICTRQLAAGAAIALHLSSGGIGRGLRLDVAPVDETTRRTYGYGYLSMLRGKGGAGQGLVMGVAHSGQEHGQGLWLVKLVAPSASTGAVAAVTAGDEDDAADQWEAFERMQESQQEQFQAAAEAFGKPDEYLGPDALVSFTGILPSKDKNGETEATDED